MQLQQGGLIPLRISTEEAAPAWQDRVINEKAELDERIVKLDAFIVSPDFWRLKTIDARLLQEQVVAMRCYSLALGKRIDQFGSAA